MIAAASKLDIARFRKVQALAESGATAGERDAAKARLRDMAKSAGVTFAKAEKLAADKPEPKPQKTASPRPDWTDTLRDIFNTPEARAERTERETKRQATVRELLDEFGSEEAATAACDLEKAIQAACEPFQVKGETTGGSWGSLSGWNGGRTLPSHVRSAIVAAVPLPDPVAGLWDEFRYWRRRGDIREAFWPGSDDPIWMRARVNILERRLDTKSGHGFADVLARVAWMRHLNNQGWRRDAAEDEELIDTLQADIERLRVLSGQADLRSPDLGSATETGPIWTRAGF